jgi:hypothetical protein
MAEVSVSIAATGTDVTTACGDGAEVANGVEVEIGAVVATTVVGMNGAVVLVAGGWDMGAIEPAGGAAVGMTMAEADWDAAEVPDNGDESDTRLLQVDLRRLYSWNARGRGLGSRRRWRGTNAVLAAGAREDREVRASRAVAHTTPGDQNDLQA